jgi:uncharacterized protein Veg
MFVSYILNSLEHTVFSLWLTNPKLIRKIDPSFFIVTYKSKTDSQNWPQFFHCDLQIRNWFVKLTPVFPLWLTNPKLIRKIDPSFFIVTYKSETDSQNWPQFFHRHLQIRNWFAKLIPVFTLWLTNPKLIRKIDPSFFIVTYKSETDS